MPNGYAKEIHTSLSLLVPLNIRMNPLSYFHVHSNNALLYFSSNFSIYMASRQNYVQLNWYCKAAQVHVCRSNELPNLWKRGSKSVRNITSRRLLAQVSLTQEIWFMVKINNKGEKRRCLLGFLFYDTDFDFDLERRQWKQSVIKLYYHIVIIILRPLNAPILTSTNLHRLSQSKLCGQQCLKQDIWKYFILFLISQVTYYYYYY